MNEAEFDQFADEYHAMHKRGIAASGEGPEYFSEYKIKDVAKAVSRPGSAVPAGLKLLDFGAGTGNSVPFVTKYFPTASLTCLDLSQRSLDLAEKRFPGQAAYVRFGGDAIPLSLIHI